MSFASTVGRVTYRFASLRELFAKASPRRSADELAGVAAESETERVAAQRALADVPLRRLLDEQVIPYESDDVTRLVVDTHDARAFERLRSLTVGELREWFLDDRTTAADCAAVRAGLTPEMVAAASKLMRNQDLIAAAQKCVVEKRFRNTIGAKGTIAVRLQPNHPTDDAAGIAASIVDGLLLGSGDAVIGINPASDSPSNVERLLRLMDELIARLEIPTQSCVLTHVTTQLDLMRQGVPLDLVFQSVAGTEATNKSFGVTLPMLREAHAQALELRRGTLGSSVMYFETGQGSCLSAGGHHGVDAQTCEARAYAVARAFDPLLVNTVVGFIGPEYLYDGKQIIRAGLEDHFCGKALGLPMGVDVCYTNHAEADQDDMDTLLTLLGVAGCAFVIGVPGADDIMLNYQSTSFHDALYLRKSLGLRPSPEFEAWLVRSGLFDAQRLLPTGTGDVQRLLGAWGESHGGR
jgi:ethanolamine ammonia-lyase large subunit